MAMTTKKLAEQIARDLFTTGGGRLAERLVLHRGRYPPDNLGGWSESAVAQRIEALLVAHIEASEQAFREASEALDEVVAPDGDKPLAQRIRDEFADFTMVIRHCSEIYDHVSRGRISKPNTLPREVITLAEDFAMQDIEEAIKEAREEWESATAGAAQVTALHPWIRSIYRIEHHVASIALVNDLIVM